MLSFSGWLQLAVINEHEHLTDYLLNGLLNRSVDEDNCEELLMQSVIFSEYKVLDALYYSVNHLDVSNCYLEACCAATEYDDAVMYQTILPLVVSNDWDELEAYLLERSLNCEHQIFQQHKSSIQRQLLHNHLQDGIDDAPRKL